MSSSNLVWVYPKDDPAWVKKIIDEFKIHPVTARLLASRKFSDLEEIHDYLYAKLPDLHDPDLFPDMDKAVGRILEALQNQENILIYGDNDVDGMTAAALLKEFLQFLGGKAVAYIPDRAVLKNGLIEDATTYARQHHCSLVITVDCGITMELQPTEGLDSKIDVIVTDHHEPTAKLPLSIATLNPKLLNTTYPNRDLTGVGVAFKLAHAITNELIEKGAISPSKVDLKRYLDLVALGTVADMGALRGENRILVRYGLKQLRRTKRVGLAKLCALCDVKLGEITSTDIASKVAPRLNSLGRIADPNKGISLLLTRDPTIAERLARELDLNNTERQKIERRDAEDIEKILATHPKIIEEKGIVLYSDKWHPGIIPIITTRIAKQYNRPTAIIAIEDGIGKGSLRTISEFPLLSFLKENSSLLINFGGHDFAAGLMIRQEQIEAFKKAFIQAANTSLKEDDLHTKLLLDGPISFADLSFDFMESLSLLEPFGSENPSPVFYTKAKQIWPPKSVGKSHLKLYLEQDDRMLEGIGFGMASKKNLLSQKNLTLEIAFTPHINTFQSKASIQLQIRDFKI